MKALKSWKTLRGTLEGVGLPPAMETALRWVERHPRTVVTGALVVAMAVLLAQSPQKPLAELDAYNGETPLFV
ncbi:MAG: hypothetical protein ACE5IP_07325 [Terriglobia bacterium]